MEILRALRELEYGGQLNVCQSVECKSGFE